MNESLLVDVGTALKNLAKQVNALLIIKIFARVLISKFEIFMQRTYGEGRKVT